MKIFIKNAEIINESRRFTGAVFIENDTIKAVYDGIYPENVIEEVDEVIDATGMWLIPGIIDDQVHFREPGLTHKADIHSESAAAVAGGVTSFMDMPNTIPQTTTIDVLNRRFDRAAETSLANYTFYMGANNENLDQLKKIDTHRVGGVKVFMGSSTGNMLVDDRKILERIFAEIPAVIAVHCEKEEIIRSNREYYTKRFGEDLPIMFHPLIRSAEACYASSAQAVELASKYDTRLHILHLSTARELSLFEDKPLEEKRITAEVCVHHLYFDDNDYAAYGNKIKWNPAIKTTGDRLALINAVKKNKIDVIATDHAPHLWCEKEGSCLKAASGGPLIQFSLLTMIEKVLEGDLSIETIVEKMCHAPARLFGIEKRGFIRPGYFADLVLINPGKKCKVTSDIILSKCGWSPFEGHTFPVTVDTTFVNGIKAYQNGVVNRACRGRELEFKG
ncbi:dihydroorotase [Coprobacter tertius]|uniref:Dihydroorotase n=1 Tax=Coprobacter tertius TaxID=2944915 RepID=A0ABT1MGN8_9BACT|nr:dihydroorotase [Coprobacter tertius]MCP9611214.1 dihydroorotase [Coprobacter tertius]